MNFLRQNNIKIYTKTLRNPYLKKNFRMNISHNPHRKEFAMKFSQLEKHVPHLKFYTLFYKIYRKGADFTCTCMSVSISKSSEKS